MLNLKTNVDLKENERTEQWLPEAGESRGGKNRERLIKFTKL
jgi:hypothetical protein